MNKTVGLLLLVVSFLAGSFLASLDAREMNWPYFTVILVIGAAGVFIFKRSAQMEARADHVLVANRSALEESLVRIRDNLRDLSARQADIPPYEMRFEIDRIFREDLNRFANARDSMKHIFSLQSYADVMSAFAAGERYINRVWSASADGYVDEVMSYVVRARDQFDEAVTEFERAKAKYS